MVSFMTFEVGGQTWFFLDIVNDELPKLLSNAGFGEKVMMYEKKSQQDVKKTDDLKETRQKNQSRFKSETA